MSDTFISSSREVHNTICMHGREGIERRQRFNQFFCLLAEHLEYDEDHQEADCYETARGWGFTTEEIDAFLASLEELGFIETSSTATQRVTVRLTHDAVKRSDMCVLFDL